MKNNKNKSTKTTEKTKPIPVSAARQIAEEYGKDQVLIFGWEAAKGSTHITTYGTDQTMGEMAEKGGKRVAEMLGMRGEKQFENYLGDKSYQEAKPRTSREYKDISEYIYREHDLILTGSEIGEIERMVLEKRLGKGFYLHENSARVFEDSLHVDYSVIEPEEETGLREFKNWTHEKTSPDFSERKDSEILWMIEFRDNLAALQICEGNEAYDEIVHHHLSRRTCLQLADMFTRAAQILFTIEENQKAEENRIRQIIDSQNLPGF